MIAIVTKSSTNVNPRSVRIAQSSRIAPVETARRCPAVHTSSARQSHRLAVSGVSPPQKKETAYARGGGVGTGSKGAGGQVERGIAQYAIGQSMMTVRGCRRIAVPIASQSAWMPRQARDLRTITPVVACRGADDSLLAPLLDEQLPSALARLQQAQPEAILALEMLRSMPPCVAHSASASPCFLASSNAEAGGRTPSRCAHVSRSASVWQQHAFQQYSAESQPQGQFSQGYRSDAVRFGARSEGSGSPSATTTNQPRSEIVR